MQKAAHHLHGITEMSTNTNFC